MVSTELLPLPPDALRRHTGGLKWRPQLQPPLGPFLWVTRRFKTGCCPRISQCFGNELQSAGIARPMKDKWNERLRCPICGNAGMASLWQDEDSETPTVQSVPSGFRIV